MRRRPGGRRRGSSTREDRQGASRPGVEGGRRRRHGRHRALRPRHVRRRRSRSSTYGARHDAAGFRAAARAPEIEARGVRRHRERERAVRRGARRAPAASCVAATRTGGEKFATLFGGPFVEAFATEAADTDRDGKVSILEAFEYAKKQVAAAYQREGLLPTEHAMLDDNGDKEGSMEPGAPGEGRPGRPRC